MIIWSEGLFRESCLNSPFLNTLLWTVSSAESGQLTPSIAGQTSPSLTAEGINIIEREKKASVKYYLPKSKNYIAKVYFQDGYFVVEEGSVIHKPKEALKNWSDDGRLYQRLTKDINSLIADGKIEDLGDTCRTLVKLPFSSVSTAASFISGASQNGWSFFKDIQELRRG